MSTNTTINPSPNRGGTLLYRCRQCGEVDRNPHVPDLLVALLCLAHRIPMPAEWGFVEPGRHGLHRCGDGMRGVSDLIGGEEDR